MAGTIAMQVVPLTLGDVTPPCAYHAPILCLELPESGAQLASVLDGPTSAASWRYHLLVDFPYLVAYGALFAGSFVRTRGGRAPAALVALGAAGDAIENVALLLALDGDRSDAIAAVARFAAHSKFVLLALGVGAGMAMLARASEGRVRRVGYALLAAAAAVGLAGWAFPLALELGLIALVPAGIALTVRAIRGARTAPAR